MFNEGQFQNVSVSVDNRDVFSRNIRHRDPRKYFVGIFRTSADDSGKFLQNLKHLPAHFTTLNFSFSI